MNDQERTQWELQAYGGVTAADIEKGLAEMTFGGDPDVLDRLMTAASILSDVQEMVELNRGEINPRLRESIRTALNRSKYHIFESRDEIRTEAQK